MTGEFAADLGVGASQCNVSPISLHRGEWRMPRLVTRNVTNLGILFPPITLAKILAADVGPRAMPSGKATSGAGHYQYSLRFTDVGANTDVHPL